MESSARLRLEVVESVAVENFKFVMLDGSIVVFQQKDMKRIWDVSSTPIVGIGIISCDHVAMYCGFMIVHGHSRIAIHKLVPGFPLVLKLELTCLNKAASAAYIAAAGEYAILAIEARCLYVVDADNSKPWRYLSIHLPNAIQSSLLQQCGSQGYLLRQTDNIVLWRLGQPNLVLCPYVADYKLRLTQNGWYSIYADGMITHFNTFTDKIDKEPAEHCHLTVHYLFCGRMTVPLDDSEALLREHTIDSVIAGCVHESRAEMFIVDAAERVLVYDDDHLVILAIEK